ncbi:MAG: hypothetical protein KIT84_20105 [Labilithrix sp.]|nr:hypothetical protein [Labilithrix sp.]
MSESPFLTERARIRAPVVMSFAAAAGAALLVSPHGEVVLADGALGEVDAMHIARRADRPMSDEERRAIAEARANPQWVHGDIVSAEIAERHDVRRRRDARDEAGLVGGAASASPRPTSRVPSSIQ